MAKPDASPLPTPASSAAQPAKREPLPKTGFDPLRPFRYLFGFVGGTLSGTLDGMAAGGRKGLWLGVGIGLLTMFATGVGSFLLLGIAGGMVMGTILGGVFGLATGGFRSVGREHRKDVYAEDLVERAQARSQAPSRADYRQAHRDQYHQSNYMMDRIFQQQGEIRHETQTYFQDRVNESRQHQHEQGY